MTARADVLGELRRLREQIKSQPLVETERRDAYREARLLMLDLESDGDTLVRLHWGVC